MFSESFFSGVASGIVASGAVALLSAFTYKVVIPFVQELFAPESENLSGTWTENKTNDPVTFLYEITLKHTGRRVRGNATITKTGTGTSDYVQKLCLNGEVWQGFLIVNLRSSDTVRLSYVSGLLKVTKRGDMLEGHWAFRGNSDLVETEDIHWTRTK